MKTYTIKAPIRIGADLLRSGTILLSEGEAADLVATGFLAEAEEQVAPALRLDGPTIEEFVAAGYRAKHYPPQGYAAISPAEDIAVYLALEEEADSQPEGGSADANTNTEIQPGAESANGLNGDDAAGAGAPALAAESTHSTTEVQTQTEGAQIAPAGGQAPAHTDNPESESGKQEAPGEAPAIKPAPTTEQPAAPNVKAKKAEPKQTKPKK